MGLGEFIPNRNQFVRIGVAMVIIFLLVKWLPIPGNVKDLFRV